MSDPVGAGPVAGTDRRRRPWIFALVGTVLAGLLAVVLFVGVGTPGGGSSLASEPVAQQTAAANLQPGINAPTADLLTLTVFPQKSTKAAPGFHLTDQSGRTVSPGMFRGKVVIVAPNDDRCTDLCTLLANDIVLADQDLGAASRDVVWLSVNANPFYPSVAAVRAWTDEHGLGGHANWYYGTGSPAALRRVWAAYGFTVELDRKARTVAHSTELFFVDPAGRERSVAQFGTNAASTGLFAHGLAQMADDLLPASERVHVAGPEVPVPTVANATVASVPSDFALPYLDDASRTYHLTADRGRETVVNFWASTCTVCRSELPGIEAAYRFAGRQVDFVGVDESDRAGAARAMAKRAGLTYPLVADPDGVAAGDDRITGLPFTMILSPSGAVLVRHPGMLTTEQLEYVLENYDAALPGT